MKRLMIGSKERGGGNSWYLLSMLLNRKLARSCLWLLLIENSRELEVRLVYVKKKNATPHPPL